MKKIITTVLLCFITLIGYSQSSSFQVSSHILDIGLGTPASAVTIRLHKLDTKKDIWMPVDEKKTDVNGRITDFLSNAKDNTGIYKLTYLVADYFKAQKTESFYPFIEVVFEIKDKSHYHVPITMSPFGYSTYRGN